MKKSEFTDKRKKNEAKQRLRLIALIILILALVWIVPRYLHTDGPSQPVPEETGQLTLLTAPPEQTAQPGASILPNVTEMKKIKHPFDEGKPARLGVEF